MERIGVEHLIVVAGRMSHLDSLTWLTRESGLSDENCQDIKKEVLEILKAGERAGEISLPGTLDQLERVKSAIDSGDFKKAGHGWHLIRSLQERFIDDMARCHVILLPSRDAELFNQEQPFGPCVFDRFPSAVVDIEEAGKCIALERGTAAVFHLMRVMEIGLRVTAKALGIGYAPSWESYLRQMKPLIEADWKKKPDEWKKEEPFFREVYSLLHGVKIAWRNPTIHVRRDYTPEMAHDVYGAVRGYMRHLATGLDERTKKRASPLV